LTAPPPKAGVEAPRSGLTDGCLKSWDFQPIKDANRQCMRNSIDLDDLAAMARNQSVRP